MKKLVLLAVASLTVLGATPSYASDVVGGVASLVGSTAATVVDVPEGILVDSLWTQPMKATHGFATHFGDEKGFEQNVVGALLGIPFGIVWGIPHGALRGARHGMSTGWEKPFSTDSFMVGMDEK